MLLKSADSKESHLAILKNLLGHEKIPADKKQLIEKELRNKSIGIATEKQAAYEIDFNFAATKNLIVLHDLRFEINGRVAQIDHLLMNRALEIYVLETKTFGTGVSINAMGEFSTTFNGREVGIPSPVEQNERHISVLKDVFKLIGLPTRLGITLQPTFHSVILVSQKAVIQRPNDSKPYKNIIKIDQFRSWYDANFDAFKVSDAVGIFKICSSDTIKILCEKMVELHHPGRLDYIKKFGLTDFLLNKAKPDPVAIPALAPAMTAPMEVPKSTAADVKENSKYFCATCRTAIYDVVAKFCWNNKSRFGGKAYCRSCQVKF